MVLDTQADKMLAELSACVQKTGPHLHSRCWLSDVYGLKENELRLGMIHTESLRVTHHCTIGDGRPVGGVGGGNFINREKLGGKNRGKNWLQICEIYKRC